MEWSRKFEIIGLSTEWRCELEIHHENSCRIVENGDARAQSSLPVIAWCTMRVASPFQLKRSRSRRNRAARQRAHVELLIWFFQLEVLEFQRNIDRKSQQLAIHRNLNSPSVNRPERLSMCAVARYVFIGVRSTFRAVRMRACGSALRNPNQPRFIGRQPEARVYTDSLKATAWPGARCTRLSPARSIKFRAQSRPLITYFEFRGRSRFQPKACTGLGRVKREPISAGCAPNLSRGRFTSAKTAACSAHCSLRGMPISPRDCSLGSLSFWRFQRNDRDNGRWKIRVQFRRLFSSISWPGKNHDFLLRPCRYVGLYLSKLWSPKSTQVSECF